MNIKPMVDRVSHLLARPEEAWQAARQEPPAASDILRDYVFKLACVPAAAHFLGFLVLLGFWKSLTRAAFLYVLSITLVWAISRLIVWLSAHYGVDEDSEKAFTLASFSLTPYFVAGASYLVPAFMVLAPVGGLYGGYLLYRGLPPMLGVAEDRAAPYAGMVSAAMFLAFLLIGRLTGGVVWPAKP
jgi:hypothetical protein